MRARVRVYTCFEFGGEAARSTSPLEPAYYTACGTSSRQRINQPMRAGKSQISIGAYYRIARYYRDDYYDNARAAVSPPTPPPPPPPLHLTAQKCLRERASERAKLRNETLSRPWSGKQPFTHLPSARWRTRRGTRRSTRQKGFSPCARHDVAGHAIPPIDSAFLIAPPADLASARTNQTNRVLELPFAK